MQPPQKHHFNPAFSLKPWADSKGEVCEMRKIAGKVAPQMRHPNATGFKQNLYKIDGVEPELAQRLETSFFKPLDTRAERALQMIIAGSSSWDGPMRSDWTRYILSLMFRMPTVVDALKQHMAEVWKEGISAFEADYENRRLPTDPPTFAEYFALTRPGAPQIATADMLIQIIDNQRIGPHIFSMKWWRVPLPKSAFELLCSDRPIYRPLGLGDPKACIALPLTPRLLFVATNGASLAEFESARDQTELVKLMNKAVVTQAREFVWASDDRQLEFVRKHMGTAPEQDLLTPAQREAAIAAATGRAPAK